MKQTERAWNPRFVNYARVHGRTPEDQLAADTRPGNDRPSMHWFVLWNGARLHEWMKLVNYPKEHDLGGRPTKAFAAFGMRHGNADHIEYDKWLSELPVGHGVEKRAAET